MKLNNKQDYYNACCQGCQSIIKDEDVDPDLLYNGWLCNTCRAELEDLPPRYKIVFERLSSKIRETAGREKMFSAQVKAMERYMREHGLNPMEVSDDYFRTGAPMTVAELLVRNKALEEECQELRNLK